jgi:CDP-glycerol glycerophosphotransferase
MQDRLKPPTQLSNAPVARAKRLLRTAPERASRASLGVRVRARRALHRRGYVPGLLSIVVPCYMVEDFLDECLVSLRFQDYRDIEIIVVDDGSPDSVPDIAKRHVRRDLRVRYVHRENGGLSAARNTGVQHARGEFLTFVDSDDVATPEAYTSAIAALEESGSDFAVSNYDRLEGTKRTPAGSWIRSAHAVRRLGVDLDTFPEAMVNAVAWSKTYRRTFWDRAGLSFPEGKLYEDQPVSAAAFGQARAFDVVPDVGVSWRIRNDRSSISQQSYSVANIAAHNDAVSASFEALRAAGQDRAIEIRALQLISFNMTFFTRHLVKGSQEFWDLLRTGILDLVHHVSRDDFVHGVGAQDKVLVELIANDRREEAVAYIENYGSDPKRFPTRVTPEGVRIDLPLTEGLPDDVNILSDRQLELNTRVMRVKWDADELTVTGWAFIRNLDLAQNPPTITVDLVSPDGETRIPLTVTSFPEPRVDWLGGHWHCDYTPGGFAATLQAEQVPADEQDWLFELTMEAAGIRRSGWFRDLSKAGSAVVAQTHNGEHGIARTVFRSLERHLVLRVTHYPAYAVGQRMERNGTAILTFRADDPDLVVVNHIDQANRHLLSVAPTPTGSGSWEVRLDLSALPRPTGSTRESGLITRPLRVRVRDRAGQFTPMLAPPGMNPSPGVIDDPTVVRRLTRSKGGELEVMDRVPVVTDYHLTDEELSLHVHSALPLEPFTALLYTPEYDVTGTLVHHGDGSYGMAFPLVGSRWGYDRLTLPKGKYAVMLRSPGSDREQDLPVTPSATLLDELPIEVPLARFRGAVEVVPNAPPVFALNVQEPLDDQTRGQRNQYRLREQSRVAVAEQDSVFFRALYSEVANCNMLGVHHELGRRGTSLTRYWSVRDYSIPVPEGGIAVIEGTREWHEAIATSRYAMINVHQPDWFRKPAGQVLIETMHGYPYKVMGHEWWEKGGFPSGQIYSFDRRAREWDYFISPASYATPLLRKAFLDPAGAQAEVLEIGYPRNDVLQSDEAAEIRDRVRKSLGIEDGQIAVMYAPTFRDYMSADDMAAERIEFLDVEKASRDLGRGYTLLVRGHAFNARAGGFQAAGDRIIDVTTHPDVNDLILASDAAILDYSSLRFDYAIVGRPMVFLVPDLVKYDAVRGGVIPFAPTAPGPHVKTTREVVTQLRDFAGLAARTAAARATFVREYVDLDDGHASARLVDAVFGPRGDA